MYADIHNFELVAVCWTRTMHCVISINTVYNFLGKLKLVYTSASQVITGGHRTEAVSK